MDDNRKDFAYYQDKRSRLSNEAISRVNYILFLVYPSIAQSAFLGLDCVWIADHRFLSSDYTIDCDTSTSYQAFFVFNLSVFICIVIGLPSLYVALLVRKVRTLLYCRLVVCFGIDYA